MEQAGLIAQLDESEVFYSPRFTDGVHFFRVSRWVGLTSPQGFYDVEEFATEAQAQERFETLTQGAGQGGGEPA